MARIAIFHPTDPLGHVPGGIDTIIRGVLKWAPSELEYTLFGATSDEQARPVGSEIPLPFGSGARFIPLVSIDPHARRSAVPVTLKYMSALLRHIRGGQSDGYDSLDFHRVETAWLFRRDRRPKNIVIHQDMSVLRNENCDIMWRHAPWLYERIERRVLLGAKHIFTVRRSAVERYSRLYPELASRISFMPTWFDSTVFVPAADTQERVRLRANLRRDFNLPPTSRVLVTVGRLDKQKDPLLMLQAFREAVGAAADVYLLLVGDGVLRAQIEQARHTLDLDERVRLLGVMPPAEIARVLGGSDLFVLSSAYEGMPIAVLEALATGLPVVSTEVGEIPLVIQNGVNGLICADRSVQSLAATMAAALDQLQHLSGTPSERSVEAYRPESVLHLIYQNHLAQGSIA